MEKQRKSFEQERQQLASQLGTAIGTFEMKDQNLSEVTSTTSTQ